MRNLFRGSSTCSVAIIFLLASSTLNAQQRPAPPADATNPWTAPDPATIPEGPLGDSIRLGLRIFNDTPKYAAAYVGNKMSCGHCHAKSGTAPYAIPIVGVPGLFPMYRDREKQVITFEERIEQCFQRSENGHRVPNNSPEMTALVAYSQWLSKDQPTAHQFPGRGLVHLPELSADAIRGSQIYSQQCATCHAPDGAGQPPKIPPLWGPDAYSDGAGMNDITKMAAFVQHNMPQTNPGSLTPQDAYDVAAYVHGKPHSRFELKEHR